MLALPQFGRSRPRTSCLCARDGRVRPSGAAAGRPRRAWRQHAMSARSGMTAGAVALRPDARSLTARNTSRETAPGSGAVLEDLAAASREPVRALDEAHVRDRAFPDVQPEAVIDNNRSLE